MRASRLIVATIRGGLCALTAVLPSAAVVSAQDAPAHMAYVDGVVSLERENEELDATRGEPLLPGDRLRTGSGLVEIWFPDGSTVDLDAYTTAELSSSSLLRLTEGRLILMVARGVDSATAVSYQIDTPWGSAVTRGPGEYRVSLTAGSREGSVELAVIRGAAQLTTDGGAISIRAGERAFARGDGPPDPPEAFNALRMDTFGRWVSTRRDERLGRAASSRYLPTNLQMYGGTFNQYGEWEIDAANGSVWYPTVDPGWRPYYNGYWSSLRPYGMTWIGLDAWGWPTHHYGRWGYARSRWFWVPERRWAPAWVSWASAPDYVSWCPIGLDNRPVFSLSVSSGNHWAGWVVLPRGSFGARHQYVNRYAVEGRRLPRNTAFVGHSQSPSPRSFRGRDNTASSRAGDVARPRDPRGAVERRGGPTGVRAASDAPRAQPDTTTTPGVRGGTPEGTDAQSSDRARAYRRGTERMQTETAPAPRVYGARPVTPRDRGATVPGRAIPRDSFDSAAGRSAPRDGQAGTAARDAGPRLPQPGASFRDTAPRDRPPGSHPSYSAPAPATPPAPQPEAPPHVNRDSGQRGASRAPAGDGANRRSAGESVPREPRSSAPPPQAERASPPRESARPAPPRESPTSIAQPRGERSSGDGGASARSRAGGSGGQGRRNQ